MNFKIDFLILVDDEIIDSASFSADVERFRADLEDPGFLEGRLVISLGDTENLCDAFAEPIVRLVDSFLRKLPWIISGDTETIALRNSEQCFAFVPAGESVELSYFLGTETEIEEYVFEPITVRLDALVTQCITMGERLLDAIRRVDASLLDSNEDVQDLKTSFDEAKRAWREHQLHNRR